VMNKIPADLKRTSIRRVAKERQYFGVASLGPSAFSGALPFLSVLFLHFMFSVFLFVFEFSILKIKPTIV